MDVSTMFRVMAVYNQRMNNQLLDTCSHLSEQQLHQKSGSFFNRIMDDWNHLLISLFLFVTSVSCSAGSIGLGKVTAVKQYDFGDTPYIRIYLASDATHTDNDCRFNGHIYGQITEPKHNQSVINRMFSLATAAYASGKKVRLFSVGPDCEIDFVALQEVNF